MTIFSISASFVTFSQYQYELGFSFKKFNRFSNHKLDIFFKFLHYSVNLVQYCFFSISIDDILVKKNTENIYLKTILIQRNYNDDIRKKKLVNHFLSWELGKMREKTQIKNQFFSISIIEREIDTETIISYLLSYRYHSDTKIGKDLLIFNFDIV